MSKRWADHETNAPNESAGGWLSQR